ncbi:MAG: glycosyltransferase [Oscillospiraceae bacterium]|nr:glycosyltransferase [Oscillospiraceae bacterium]
MATYEPRLDWLKEQLLSLNAQNYPTLRLYIRDDASRAVPLEKIRALAETCITRFPFTIAQNTENLGSNRTFEFLTKEADGGYFAYCDQDDIWLPEKLSVLQESLEQSGSKLICSDMYVIDGDGKQIADNIHKARHTVTLLAGDGLADGLLFHNFVTGCTTLIRAEDAKAALPFCPYYVHDQHLAIWCADRGRIESLKKPLIRYRIHDENQTAQLIGVHDKSSYEDMRITLTRNRLEWLRDHMQMSEDLRKTVETGIVWTKARQQNWNRRGGRGTVWKYRKYSMVPALFELTCNWLPESVFKKLIDFGKRI